MAGRHTPLELVTAGDQDVAVVHATGSLDMATTEQLETVVTGALVSYSTVVVDVSGVDSCDSTGLGSLVRLHRRASAGNRVLELRGPQPHVAELLAMTGIDKVIPVRASG